MKTITRFAASCGIVLLAPSHTFAQATSTVALAPPVHPAAPMCELRNGDRGSGWHDIVQARALGGDAAKAALWSIQDSIAAEALARPDDVDHQFLLAATLGARADVEDGREKIRAAKALHAQANRVLALDPTHPGAQYLLGRLHAAVLRLDRVTRFLATKLLGGVQLAGASWEEARRLLEAAVSGDPCVAEYHYELARLYAERGEPARAAHQLESLFVYIGVGASDVTAQNAQTLLADVTHRVKK